MIADRAITLPDVIARALDLRLAHTHVALPAQIVSFDPVTQLAQVKPLLQEVEEHEDGTETASSIPVLIDVPVQFPGSSAFVLTFPVQAGDYCMVIFQDRSIDNWLDNGGDVDPQDARRHHLSDAVALLGVRPLPSVVAPFDTDRTYLGGTGASSSGVGVAVDPTGVIHLGVAPNSAATDAIALASKVATELNSIRTTLGSHTHAVATTGTALAQTGTAAAIGALGPAGSTASLVVKAM